ncbi:hypothetical protein [Halobacterium wangiae]|uniref:hypothetical protein n=1 Tax=Halobacterium wangiae TaxID=2902623 RepID=UPI001E651C2E|nr:hypothetical protein [Halobacterium wangiae]
MPYCTACGRDVEPSLDSCPDCATELRVGSATTEDETRAGRENTGNRRPAEQSTSWSRARQVATVGAVVGIAASQLTWFRVSEPAVQLSVVGTDGGGMWTLAAAAIVLALSVKQWEHRGHVATVALGAGVAVYALALVNDPYFGNSLGAFAESGAGLLVYQVVSNPPSGYSIGLLLESIAPAEGVYWTAAAGAAMAWGGGRELPADG